MSDRQFKNLPYFKVESKGREQKGICAVFGNVDAGGDRIMPGAFAKTISENRSRIKHLWNHDFSTPPIASITELKEIGRDELPQEVLDYAPEATGGLMVAREYYDTEFSNWVRQGVEKGDITEMSFGYDVLNYEERKEGTEDNPRYIRELKELKLYDTSDVLWGMNAATVAAGAKSAMPLGLLVSHLQIFAEDVKAGRRNSGSDQILINALHDISMSLGCDTCGAKQDEEKQAEAAERTSLEFLMLAKQRLKLASSTLGAI